MSPRYYLISAIVVFVLTAAIGVARRTRSWRETLAILCWVVSGLVLIVAVLAGIAQLLATLGIAQSGYIF